MELILKILFLAYLGTGKYTKASPSSTKSMKWTLLDFHKPVSPEVCWVTVWADCSPLSSSSSDPRGRCSLAVSVWASEQQETRDPKAPGDQR